MDTVPWRFIEGVCLRVNRPTLEKSALMPSRWGAESKRTSDKIHLLRVVVNNRHGKLCAAAQPMWSEDDDNLDVFPTDVHGGFEDFDGVVPLDTVNPRFLTSFSIYESNGWPPEDSGYQEITLDHLQRLVHFIRPARRERHPPRWDCRSTSSMILVHDLKISAKLLSMRLPVDQLIM
uniref:Uncharacterized protein n=1 Tax=Steinernema glaseri TaxID=37863 RepID=A0A1I7ZAD0_9BILA